jgi:hypothetical protein
MNLKKFLVPKGLPPPTTHIELDFVVAERPRYVPGTGPPLAPVTIMPPSDNNGYIFDQVIIDSEPRYIVCYREQANLRVSVRLPNILNWISPRALEDWTTKKYDAEVQEEEERELPIIEAREAAKKKRLEKLARAEVPAGTSSRKRKRRPINEAPPQPKKAVTPGLGATSSPARPRAPGSRHHVVEEEVTFTSPKQSRHSQQQPSLSGLGSGLANRTVLDTDTEEEDTELALQYQLTGRIGPRSRSVSKPTDSGRRGSPLASTAAKKRSIRPPSSHSSGALAAISSREALRVYEELERKDSESRTTKKIKSIAEKYSHQIKKPQPQIFKGAHIGLPPSRSLANVDAEEEGTDDQEQKGDQAADEESEYEVRQILKHEVRYTRDGKPDYWYLIDWVGDWDNTWEPAENVGQGAIDAYNKKRKNKKVNLGSIPPVDGNDSDPDELFVSQGKGGSNHVQRGQIIDEYDDDLDDF